MWSAYWLLLASHATFLKPRHERTSNLRPCCRRRLTAACFTSHNFTAALVAVRGHLVVLLLLFFFFFHVCQEPVIRETGSDGSTRWSHTRLTVMDCHAKGSGGDNVLCGRFLTIEWVELDFYCLLHIIDSPWIFIRVDTWEQWGGVA